MSRQSLTLYRIREDAGGTPIANFDDIIRSEYLDSSELATYEIGEQFDFEGRLYVWIPVPTEPSWSSFLRAGFEELEIPEMALNRAVLVVRVTYYGRPRYFAFTFGAGRHLLRPNAWEPSFGLRTALNVIYRDDDPASPAPPSVRHIDAKTVAANTFRTRRQANRYSAFEEFGVDIREDILSGVTGIPADSVWGTRIGGADPLHLNLEVHFADLGDLCRKAWRTERFEDYRARFAWIDNIAVVRDGDLCIRLEEITLDTLQAGRVEDLDLAPPELVEWDELDHFRFSLSPDETFGELRLRDYLSVLQQSGRQSQLTLNMLKRGHRVETIDIEGELLGSWPVFRCLDGEISLDGKSYLLVEGDFFEVATEYRHELDAYIGSLPECSVNLPPSRRQPDGRELGEEQYNEEAAASSSDFLLLDKKMIRVTTHTSPVEICDILTSDPCFIHVKRKLGSSSLSHLFAQGSVSADLFVMSEKYRRAVSDRVGAAEAERADDEGDEAFRGRFSTLLAAARPENTEIVYAIIAFWDGRSLVDALPFFSKVNLRRHVDDLRRMGYRASYKRIEVR